MKQLNAYVYTIHSKYSGAHTGVLTFTVVNTIQCMGSVFYMKLKKLAMENYSDDIQFLH